MATRLHTQVCNSCRFGQTHPLGHGWPQMPFNLCTVRLCQPPLTGMSGDNKKGRFGCNSKKTLTTRAGFAPSTSQASYRANQSNCKAERAQAEGWPELSAAQIGNLLTFVDPNSAQRRSETCRPLWIRTHRKLADLCGSEVSAAQVGNLLTFVDRKSAQRRSETCWPLWIGIQRSAVRQKR